MQRRILHTLVLVAWFGLVAQEANSEDGASMSVATQQEYPTAQAAYDAGHELWQLTTPEALKASRQCFRQAIELDPNFALAYVGLARSYVMLQRLFYDPEVAKSRPWRAAIDMALALDDSLAEAHAMLGNIRFKDDWDWEGARRHYLLALELDPNLVEALLHYSHWLSSTGRHEESLVEIMKAKRLAPDDPFIGANVGARYYFLNKYDRAVQECEKIVDLVPDHFVAHMILGKSLAMLGEHERAIAALTDAYRLSGEAPDVLSELGNAQARAGNREQANEILDSLLTAENTPAFLIAYVYIGLEQYDEAFVWLEKSVLDHDWRLLGLINIPELDRVRQDQRFVNLAHRVGAPEY